MIKEFYTEHPEVSGMTEKEVRQFRSDNNNIIVSNFDEKSEAPLLKPCPEFRHAFEPNFPEIMSTIERQGFQRPSPIQAQGWPYLLSGKDLIGIAQVSKAKSSYKFCKFCLLCKSSIVELSSLSESTSLV